MDYTGMIGKFKVGRPLSDEERKLQLRQRERSDLKPFYFWSTIRINSTFIELVDKYYAGRGFLTFTLFILIPFCVFLFVLGIYIFVVGGLLSDKYDRNIAIYAGAFGLLLVIALLLFMFWLVNKDAFTLTHYPIRLNRKTRMVHVFRLNGEVLSVPWDSLFFTIGRADRFFGIQHWDLRVHVLDADKVTVRDTFTVSVSGPIQDDVRLHFEYLKRYMEDGPQAVIPYTPAYLPIAERRETWRFGLMIYLTQLQNITILQIVGLPVLLIFSLGRRLAMRTSKIPVWPSEIEEACRIDADDPYRRDERDNPHELWAAFKKTQYS